jgi:hypothetical protein
MLSPLYMAEISPPEVRGSLMALEQFAIVLGVVCGFWTGFLTRSGHFFPNLANIYSNILTTQYCYNQFQAPLPGASLWESRYFQE